MDSMPAFEPGAKSTWASSSRLLEGVSSTVAEMRSPLSPKVPSCPVATRRAFSLAALPVPSETITRGPSSSQRSRGRLAAERRVHAQSSFCALASRGSVGSHCITSYSVFRVRFTTVLARTRTFSRREGRKDVPIALTA